MNHNVPTHSKSFQPRALFSEKAPPPIGPYSQAVECGNLIFMSGQIPIDPATGEVTGTTITEQTRRTIGNMKTFLADQELSTRSIIKVTVYLRDLTHFAEFNTVYAEEMQEWKPARSVVEVSRLPRDVLIEIEAIACR
jgi:2-iminobutanoate/2-iminopropanoate deaminase